MKKVLLIAAALAVPLTTLTAFATTPEEDVEIFRKHYQKRFPGVPFAEFANGVYSIDPVGRESWEAIEEFPPYEPTIDDGEEMWNTPFANGKTYKDCFPDGPGGSGSVSPMG